METVKVFAPATIANLNVGFDTLGLALQHVGDTVELTLNGTRQNRITAITDGPGIPSDPQKNCCSVVVKEMQNALGDHRGTDIKITKGFASGSGMGSSSASSAAAAFGYNELAGRPFSRKELVAFAAKGEEIACGSAHTDNVAPALLGGLVLSKGHRPEDLIELPLPGNLQAVILFPQITINTANSRQILKDKVSLAIASAQAGLMGAFVSSLYENNLDRFSDSLRDLVIEPTRGILIPGFYRLKEAAAKNGALASGISGSGPSVFAITHGPENAGRVHQAMQSVYQDIQVKYKLYQSPVSGGGGAHIIA